LNSFDRELAEYWRLRTSGHDELTEHELATWPSNRAHDHGRRLVPALEKLARAMMNQARQLAELSAELERIAPSLTAKLPEVKTEARSKPIRPGVRFCIYGCGARLDDCECEGGPVTYNPSER
jgi:hypothetical protein